MNTLVLRTRFLNISSSSGSSRGSFNPRHPRSSNVRPARPVFVSSPSPKKSNAGAPQAT